MTERRIYNVDVSKMSTKEAEKLIKDTIREYRREVKIDYENMSEDERKKFFYGFWEPKDVTRND